MDFDRIYDKVAAPAAAGSDPVMAPDVLGFGDIYDRVKPVQAKKRTHGGAAGKFIGGGGGDFGGTGASVKFGDSASEAEAKEIAAKVKLSPIDKWFDRTLRNKEPEKTKELYAKAGDFLTGSAADYSKRFYSTVDFILPDEIINQGDNWFSKFLDDAQQITQEKADKKNDIIAKQGPAGKAALKFTDNVLQAVPQVIAAILSGGTSTSAQAAAQLGTQGAGLAQTVIAYLKQLAKNPSFYLSLTQTLGESYEDAVADGAAEQEAVSTALISSLLNSAVEAGGGIEKIPGGKRSLRNWVKGMAEEGGEEVVQGVIDQLTRKAVYDPDKPLAGFNAKQVNRLLGTDIPQDVSNALLSTTGEAAVFDPMRAVQEFGLGAAVGGILGAGEMAVQGRRYDKKPPCERRPWSRCGCFRAWTKRSRRHNRFYGSGCVRIRRSKGERWGRPRETG